MKPIKVRVSQLQPGIFIQIPVKWDDHPFLSNRFKIESEEEIQVLEAMNIDVVIAFPSMSDSRPLPKESERTSSSEIKPQPETEGQESEETSSEHLASSDASVNHLLGSPEKIKAALLQNYEKKKQEKITELVNFRKDILRIGNQYKRALALVNNVLKQMQRSSTEAMQFANETIDDMLDVLQTHGDKILHVISDFHEGDTLNYHSLNVAILAMMIAKTLNREEEDIKLIGIAGLLHDIGNEKLPKVLFTKKAPLSEKEQKIEKNHVQQSVDILNQVAELDERVINFVQQHHEYADGTGHPAGVELDEIEPMSLIIRLADDLDTLCHPYYTKKAKLPAQVVPYLFKSVKQRYCPDSLNALVKTLGIYPAGSTVQLSNGQIAVVISVNHDNILMPNVLIYDSSVPRDYAVITSLVDTGFKIEKPLNPKDLKTETYEYLNPRAKYNYYFMAK